MKWRSVLPIGLLGMTALASCDCDHEEDMSAISELQVGSVVCADGTVLSEKRFEESGKEAMGIVFYVDSDNELGNLGYAVYIHDIEPLAFADTLGVDLRHPLHFPKKTATRIPIRSSTARTWLHRWR